jgi:hypothetical protein
MVKDERVRPKGAGIADSADALDCHFQAVIKTCPFVLIAVGLYCCQVMSNSTRTLKKN